MLRAAASARGISFSVAVCVWSRERVTRCRRRLATGRHPRDPVGFEAPGGGETILNDGRLQREGYSVEALRQLAKRRLPRMVFDFCDGGAEDEITRHRN